LASGKNANLSLGMLCASYVSSQRSSTPHATAVQLAACRWLAMYSLSQHLDKAGSACEVLEHA
jgi:hypothetical protein